GSAGSDRCDSAGCGRFEIRPGNQSESMMGQKQFSEGSETAPVEVQGVFFTRALLMLLKELVHFAVKVHQAYPGIGNPKSLIQGMASLPIGIFDEKTGYNRQDAYSGMGFLQHQVQDAMGQAGDFIGRFSVRQIRVSESQYDQIRSFPDHMQRRFPDGILPASLFPAI